MRQVGRQVRHHVAADELPPEVIVLALAVLALARVTVLLKGAAGCGQRDPSDPKSPAGMMGCPQTRGDPRHPLHVSQARVRPCLPPTPISPIRSPPSERRWQVSAPGGLSRGSRMQLPALLPGGRSPNRVFLPRKRHFAVVTQGCARPWGLLQKSSLDQSPAHVGRAVP